MTTKRISILVLAVCCGACGLIESRAQGQDAALPVMQSGAGGEPGTIELGSALQRRQLIGQLNGKRAIFIGEVHDRLEHHQNQLRIIQELYASDPDMAIGVEYFQQPFQAYLDDYIAGRIDEREMLKKTEYFQRWQLDYRLLQPIFAFAREKHIPVLALNVSDEIHNKVFKGGMKSLNAGELAQTPDEIQPASRHYLQRLETIFNSHPPSNDFGTFVEGVLLWDESMADITARYLKSHPQARVVVLAGMVHVMYGDGIPERVNRRLGGNHSAVLINGNDFGAYPGVADYQLATEGGKELPKAGMLGISIIDGKDNVYVSEFPANSSARAAGVEIGDYIVALNGIKVENLAGLKAIMFDKQPGERMRVAVRRKRPDNSRQELQLEVVLR
ncbi:MAG: ChaN family lipoprotein [Nitrosomonadales bacterium]|nr:ChaN family lipoprotein [Nitrosomonadales bacterium]